MPIIIVPKTGCLLCLQASEPSLKIPLWEPYFQHLKTTRDLRKNLFLG